MKRKKWLVLGCILTLLCILCFAAFDFFWPLDVTFDPAYGFRHLAGSKYKAKVQLALAAHGTALSLRTSTYFYEREHSFAATDPKYNNGGERIVEILEPGTVIQIDRLVNIRGTLGLLVVHGSLPTGAYAHNDVILEDDLFLPNNFSAPGSSLPAAWAVAPDVLEKP